MRPGHLTIILFAGVTGCLHLGTAIFGMGSTESRRWPQIEPERVWEVLQEAVSDFYDIHKALDDEMYLETEWNEQLGPMYKTGRRMRARVWVRIDENARAPFIEVTVDRQVNTNMSRPLSKSEADWVTDWDVDGRDISRENRLIWLVNFRLRKIKPSREIIENEPSEYSRDPKEKAEEDLWGKEKKEGTGPKKRDEEIWK